MNELGWRVQRRGLTHVVLAGVCIGLLAACSDAPTEPVVRGARAVVLASATAEQVDGEYIVIFIGDVRDPAGKANELIARMAGSELLRVYEHAVKGFAAAIPQDQLTVLRDDPDVAHVQPNFLHELARDVAAPVGAVQTDAPWGLDRIDQRDLPLDETFHYVGTGEGVWAYVLDSGIRFTHEEFGGRATLGADFHDQPNGGDDCQGHGTHVAATVGGATYGVAKEVNLVAVRVGRPCPSPYIDSGQLLAAADWVTAQKIANPDRTMLVNMSIGGPLDPALDAAIAGAVGAGTTWVVSAGNESIDACSRSPARNPEAVTVGATRDTDSRSSFSNYGSCVDIFAPGQDIVSASLTGDDATTTKSGTSMASPHVAGVAALFLERNLQATPAEVAAWLVSNATPDRLSSVGLNSPNLLLHLPEFIAGTVEIAIDIIPGSAANPVRTDRAGKLPVAVLATAQFDPATLLLETVRLGDESAPDAPVLQQGKTWMAGLEDVNGDGLIDLVLHFSVPVLMANGDLHPATTHLVLTGETSAGDSARGEDVVSIIP